MNFLDSMLVYLGFKVDTEGIDQFEKKTDELRNAALALGATFTAAAVGVGLFVEHVAHSMNEVYEASELYQVSAKNIQAMSYAGIEFGIAAEAMRSGLQGIARTTGQAAAGIGRGKMLFEKMGLSARDASGHVKSVDQMLESIADKMKGKSRAENIMLASRLGMDPKMVLMLEKGSEAFKKLREDAMGMAPFEQEDFEQAHKVTVMFEKAKYVLGLMSQQIAFKLMPYVVKVLDYFMRWFKELREGTAGKFSEALKIMTAALSSLWDWLERTADAALHGLQWLAKFRVVMLATSVIVAGLIAYKLGAWMMMLAEGIKTATTAMLAFDTASLPVVWWTVAIGAAAIAIGLIVDDIWNWYHGNKSLFGDLVARFPWLLGALQMVGDMLSTVGRMFMAAWSDLKKPIMDLISSVWGLIEVLWPILRPILKAIFGAAGLAMLLLFIGAVQTLVIVAKTLGVVFNVIGQVVQKIVDKVTWAVNGVTSLIGKIPGASGLLDSIGSAGSSFGSSMVARSGILGRGESTSRTSTSTTYMVSNHTPITVHTNEPEKAAGLVKDHFDRTTRQSVRNGQTAVVL